LVDRPENLRIDTLVFVTKAIAEVTNAAPWNLLRASGGELLGNVPRGLADDFQEPFERRLNYGISGDLLKRPPRKHVANFLNGLLNVKQPLFHPVDHQKISMPSRASSS